MQCTPALVIARQVDEQQFLVLVLVRVRELRFDRKATPKERQLVVPQVEQRLHR